MCHPLPGADIANGSQLTLLSLPRLQALMLNDHDASIFLLLCGRLVLINRDVSSLPICCSQNSRCALDPNVPSAGVLGSPVPFTWKFSARQQRGYSLIQPSLKAA